jgi:branched-subunit amino acid transport protein
VLPDWVQRGLRYAPLAALAAVVVPEILMSQGRLVAEPWLDARLYAAVAATAYYFARRGILGTILTGMAVLLPLRLGLGW